MRIGVVGAGWFGCHVARVLKSMGHDVTLFEKCGRIFSGISGSFGIRLHRGPHYPRSPVTREGCARGYKKFHKHYHDLIVRHGHSIYALGDLDAAGQSSKVDVETFEAVCRETKDCRKVTTADKDWQYEHLLSVMDIKEPSILLGERLRATFEALLKDEGIDLRCNYNVTKMESDGNQVTISNGETEEKFDYVINATSYQNLLPTDDLPFDMDVVYQPCLALVYEDQQAERFPFSFITLDGWFPCMMPYVEEDPMKETHEGRRKYIVTHGKWTILGSCESPAEAQNLLESVDSSYIEEKVRQNCESSLHSFWPRFTVQNTDSEAENKEGRFIYKGWKSAIIAKLRTNREFRSAITFEKDRIIYVISGKVSNIFDVAKEVKALIAPRIQDVIISKDGYNYVQGGVLDAGTQEITEEITHPERNTCMLQTYKEHQNKSPEEDIEKEKERDEKEKPEGDKTKRTSPELTLLCGAEDQQEGARVIKHPSSLWKTPPSVKNAPMHKLHNSFNK